MEISKKTIDIEGVFRSKSQRTARLIPGFIYSYLKKIIHENEINEFLYTNRNNTGLAFVNEVIKFFEIETKVSGEENIPLDGRQIIAANHPLGGLDGMALMYVIGLKRKDIIFPVNDLLMFLPQMHDLFIPINKHGSNTENIKVIHDTFDSEKLILFFPAGLVSRKQNGVIEDLEWKPTFISRAKKHKRDIIPVYIDGRNSNFFYRLANFRKFTGLKANIEMLYLPNEMMKQKNKIINIHFGKPIPYDTFDHRYNNKIWANKVKRFVFDSLADKSKSKVFNGETNEG